jgi:hypothetical protein
MSVTNMSMGNNPEGSDLPLIYVVTRSNSVWGIKVGKLLCEGSDFAMVQSSYERGHLQPFYFKKSLECQRPNKI